MDDWRTTTDWEHIADRLLSWTIGAFGPVFPQGQQAEDIVQTVIQKAWDGTRNYDPAKGDLYPWLIDQVRSEVSNLRNHTPSQKEHRYDFSGAEDELHPEDGEPATVDPYAKSSRAGPQLRRAEAALEASDQRSALERRLRSFAQDDPQLTELVEVIVGGAVKAKPAAYAKALQTDVRDIYQRLQKLRRRLRTVGDPTGR